MPRFVPILLACLALASAPPTRAAAAAPGHAAADAAILRIDLDDGVITVHRGAEARTDSLDGQTLRADLSALLARFASGGDDPRARGALGERLLGRAAPLLREAPRWIVVPAAADASPGPLAVIAALDLPWTSDHAPVVSAHELGFDWSASFAPVVARPGAARTNGALLLVAPFEAGVAPRTDDPDTLRQALRGGLARVELLPRNETDASALRRALETDPVAALWLRAAADQLGALRPALGAFPTLVVWTLPSRDREARLALTPATLASGGAGPSTVVVQSWPVDETALAPLARTFADGLARGLPVATALAEAQRERWRAGDPAAVWASLQVVGAGDLQVRLARAPWLRRLFAPR